MMTVKKSNIRKEIDSQFEVKQQQEDIDDFDNSFANAIQNLISDDIQTLHSEDISDRFNSLRTKSFTDDKPIKGKPTSRSKVFKDSFNSLDKSNTGDNSNDSDSEGEGTGNEDSIQEDSDNEGALFDEDEKSSLDDGIHEEDESDNKDVEEEEDDDEDSGEEEDDFSITGSDIDHDDVNDLDITTNNDVLDLYSKQSKSLEIEKGKAVQHQIGLWDTFLECRIRLQKAIVAFNKYPTKEVMKKYNLHEELKEEISKAQEAVFMLMETLVSVHAELCKQYTGENVPSNLKRKLPSSNSEMSKKRKLQEYQALIEEMKTNFSAYQNEAIQKWNEKTKIAAGKMGNSGADQSVLAQIEHILNDRERLVRRTQQRKSKYTRVGERGETKEDVDVEYDVETFDDDDFYHKILRDYIEKKTVDVNDPQKLGKQWMELQKLRSKMKRKVDVKCTKGRRLRYGVHEKLVNFMAPMLSHQWNPEAETELFKSLFGRRK